MQVETMHGLVKSYDEAARKDLVTKGDLQDTKHELLKWMMAMFLAQTAMLIAVIAFIK